MTQRVIIQEPDRIHARWIVMIAITTLVVFAIGIFTAWTILQARQIRLLGGRHPAPPAPIDRDEVGIVDQKPFDTRFTVDEQEGQRRRLESYGWVDRERGIVHQPIERAMEQIVGEAGR
jgi:hypothetical protein